MLKAQMTAELFGHYKLPPMGDPQISAEYAVSATEAIINVLDLSAHGEAEMRSETKNDPEFDIALIHSSAIQIRNMCDAPHWDAERKDKIRTLADRIDKEFTRGR